MSKNKKGKQPGADGDQRSGKRPDADNDIKRLHQLEQAIGEKLEQRDFDEILEPGLPGYALVGPDGFEQIVGLNLDNIELGQAAALIADFRNLHLLSLRSCQLTDISFIQELSQLTHLSLTWIKITDISSLQVLGQLTELNLDITYITDFSPLQGLSQLKHLSLGANQITDISFLQGLSKLTELILTYNQITDISLLQGLSQLTRLDLGGNQITDISLLQGLTQLTRLDLGSNQITDISSLQRLSNLTSLSLSSNPIRDYSILRGMSQLTELRLSNNQITDISFLLGLNNLELVDLRQNEITQLPEVFMQWGLEIDVSEEYGSGHNIYLYGNPLEKPPLEIIKQGNTAIQAYFDSLKADTLPLNGVKVPLVSESVTWKTSPVYAINKRWQVLNDLDQRISDSHTLEKDLHRLMETNLWILGTEYDRLSSDESLKTQVEEYLGKEYRGARARKRPDLVLARDSGQRFLLLELKKPGHILDRHDGAQAQTYADELNQYLPQVKIEVVVLGGKVDSTLTARNQGQEVKYLSYRQVVSNARKSLEWLLVDMRKD